MRNVISMQYTPSFSHHRQQDRMIVVGNENRHFHMLEQHHHHQQQMKLRVKNPIWGPKWQNKVIKNRLQAWATWMTSFEFFWASFLLLLRWFWKGFFWIWIWWVNFLLIFFEGLFGEFNPNLKDFECDKSYVSLHKPFQEPQSIITPPPPS